VPRVTSIIPEGRPGAATIWGFLAIPGIEWNKAGRTGHNHNEGVRWPTPPAIWRCAIEVWDTVNRIRNSFLSRLTPARRRGLYEVWVGEHATDLYRMAYRLCGNADTAEDLVQETFYHAWKDMSKLREQDKARPWLYQILRHRYARWVRDRTRRVETVPIDPRTNEVIDPSPSALVRLSRRDELQAALNELDDRHRC